MEEPRQRQKHFSAPDLSCRCGASVPQHVLKELKVPKKMDHFRVCLRCLNMIELLKWGIFVYCWLRALRSAGCRTTEGGLATGLAGLTGNGNMTMDAMGNPPAFSTDLTKAS